jgi:adenylate kinase family enzyme
MRRIMIQGNSGSGKSTLARALGATLRLPVLHLDTIYWKPGWVEASSEEYDAKLAAFLEHDVCQRDGWVIDGNNSRTMPQRFALADTVIVFDLPVWISLYRVFKRFLRYRRRTRLDLPSGCNEKLDLEFVRWIVSHYPKHLRPKNLDLLEQARQAGKRAVLLRTVQEVKVFTHSLGLDLSA